MNKYHGGIKAGKTSVSILVGILKKTADGLAATGIAHGSVTAYYLRQGSTPVAITLSALANIDSGYSSGGWKEADATNQKGWYRLDLPDAMLATGPDFVVLTIQTATTFEFGLLIPLEDQGAVEVKGVVDAIKLKTDNLPSGVTKNAAFVFVFKLVKAADPSQTLSGASPTVQFRKQNGDGGSPSNYVGLTGAPAISEIGSSGRYWVLVPAADMNNDVVSLKAEATGGIPVDLTLYTEPA